MGVIHLFAADGALGPTLFVLCNELLKHREPTCASGNDDCGIELKLMTWIGTIKYVLGHGGLYVLCMSEAKMLSYPMQRLLFRQERVNVPMLQTPKSTHQPSWSKNGMAAPELLW
eukprot:scaffold273423_cov22-Prasinocladus_malaysianus.AAC.2